MSSKNQFIECTSLNISFDVYGFATMTYSIISSDLNVDIITSFFGVTGYPIYIKQEPMMEVKNFFITQVTILGVKN